MGIRALIVLLAFGLMGQPCSAKEVNQPSSSACPAGLFISEATNQCTPPSRYNTLPLDAELPMKFEAIQVSMVIIWIQATGTITKDTPAEFEKFLATNDAKLSRTIYFHSPGGNLVAGMRLGEMIRKAGYNTSIGHSIPLEGLMDVYSYNDAFCASACAYAFLGGVTRSYGEHDRYGLHRFGSPEKFSTDEAQVITSLIAAYIERMGVSQSVLQLASSTPFEGDILWVPVDVARQTKVIYDNSGLTEFRIEQRGSRPVALFVFAEREKRYEGLIMCGKGTPMLAIFDVGGSVPDILKAASNFPAEFNSPQGRLPARATFFLPTKKGGFPYMLFTIPGLRPAMFEGSGLSLGNIWNPQIEAAAKGKPVVESFATKVPWADAVSAYAFRISGSNGGSTLPLVLDQCR